MARFSLVFSLLTLTLVISTHSNRVIADARDDVDLIPTAVFLAEQYGLYDDALAMLERVDDEIKKRVAQAKIHKIHALAVREGDSAQANELYEMAISLLRDAEDDKARLEYATLLIDIAESSPGDPKATNIQRLDDARVAVDELWEAINNRPNPIGWARNDDGSISEAYTVFSKAYYERGRARYRLALLEPAGSPERKAHLDRVDAILSDMIFERLIDEIPILFDAHILLGDASRAMPDPQLAIQKYLDLAIYLSDYPKSHPIVRFQSLRGYTKAVETLIDDLGSDPESLEEARVLINEALRDFPLAVNEAQGKELRMYDISAQVKLGVGKVEDALERLFELAADPDPLFRYKALSQLARIAQSSEITNAQRLRCAQEVSRSNDAALLMQSSQILHSLLASLSSSKEFETYAPISYIMLIQNCEALGRYLDSAMISREAADRLNFFRSKYDEGSEEALPAHFFDETGKPVCTSSASIVIELKTENDAFNLPKEFAKRAKAAAGWLIGSKNGGDKSNKAFRSFENEIEDWFTKYQGDEERYRAVVSTGYDLFEKGSDWVSAAQHLLSALKGGAALQANYYAGVAFVSAYTGPRTPTEGLVAREAFWNEGYQIDDLDFKAQRDRVERDFSKLPENLHQELYDAIDLFMAPDRIAADRRLDTRAMAIFAFKRAMMNEINRRAQDIEESGYDLSSGNLAQALAALASVENRAFLSTPENQRKASSTMLLLAKNTYQLTYVYREPKMDRAGADAAKLIEEVRTRDADAALDYLRMALDAFGPHLDAEITRGRDASARSSALQLKRFFLKLRFKVFVEKNLAEEAQRDFIEYRALFEKLGTTEEQRTTKQELTSMAHSLRSTLSSYGSPIWNGLNKARSQTNYVRNIFISRDQAEPFAKSNWQKEHEGKSFDELSDTQRRQVVADYVHAFLMERVFGSDATYKAGERSDLLLKNVLPEGEEENFEAWWESQRELYNQLYQDGFIDVLKDLEDDPSVTLAKDAIAKAAKTARKQGPQEALAELAEAYTKAKDEKLKDQLSFAISRAESESQLYAWVDSPSFKAALLRFLLEREETYSQQAAMPIRRWLEAAELYANMNGEELYDASSAKNYAIFYVSARDWKKAHDAWATVVEARKSDFGDQAYIETDDRREDVGSRHAPDELEARYHLGHAALEMARVTEGKEREQYLDTALHQLRRAYNFALIRNNLEARTTLKGSQWRKKLLTSDLGKILDRHYLEILEDYAAVCALYADNNLTPNWKYQYYNQQLETPVHEEGNFYELPKSQAELYLEAAFIHFQVFNGLSSRGGGSYRHDYRKAYLTWVDIRRKEAKALDTIDEKSADKIREQIEDSLKRTYESKPFMFDSAGEAFMNEVRSRMTNPPKNDAQGDNNAQ